MSATFQPRASLMPITSYTVPVLKKLLTELSIPFTSKMLKADLYELYKSTYPAGDASPRASSRGSSTANTPLFEPEEGVPLPNLIGIAGSFEFTPATIPPPAELAPGTVLKSVQEDCVQFMNAREKIYHYGVCGGIVALNMGVGKTLATAYASLAISALNSTVSGTPRKPTLIVCSKTVMNAWKTELTKFFPTAKALFLHTDFITRSSMNAVTPATYDYYDFVVTCYDIIARNAAKTGVTEQVQVFGEGGKVIGRTIRRPDMIRGVYNVTGVSSIFFYEFDRLIVDESHTISNIKTSKAEAVMAIVARKRWCVTGTLMKNSANDIFSQLVALGYDGVSRGGDMKPELFHEQKLGKLVFAKEDVETVLPPIQQYNVSVEFTPNERAFYENIKKALLDDLRSSDAGSNFAVIFAEFTRLRQSCCSAALLYNVFKTLDNKMQNFVASDRARLSSKYQKMLQVIQFTPPEEQIIVFSSFAENLNVFKGYLDKNRISNITIDGSVTGVNRNNALESFKNARSPSGAPIKVLLMTYKVGSEGLTITNANHVLLCEPWWNHATHRQAIARVHRTGQTRPVKVYKFVCKNTIEEQIYAMCEFKSSIEDDFNEGVNAGAPSMNIETMRRILSIDSVTSKHVDDAELTCMICHGVGGTFPITACACKQPSAHTDCLEEWFKNSAHTGDKRCFACRSEYKHTSVLA